jgi:hypothetical protein
MDTTLVPVYTAFGGIILGAVVSFWPAYILDCLKRKAEVEAVTGAIVTEIRVSLCLVEKRRYVESIEEVLAAIRAGKIAGSSFQVMVPDDYCPIFKSHLDKIGIIPAKIRNDVVMFYQLLEAAICDVRPGGLIAANQRGEREFAELHHIATEAVRVGRKIVNAYPIPEGE